MNYFDCWWFFEAWINHFVNSFLQTYATKICPFKMSWNELLFMNQALSSVCPLLLGYLFCSLILHSLLPVLQVNAILYRNRPCGFLYFHCEDVLNISVDQYMNRTTEPWVFQILSTVRLWKAVTLMICYRVVSHLCMGRWLPECNASLWNKPQLV